MFFIDSMELSGKASDHVNELSISVFIIQDISQLLATNLSTAVQCAENLINLYDFWINYSII